MSDQAVDWLARDTALLRVRNAYGMIVTGDLMKPAISSGDTVQVNPNKPPHPGNFCVFRSCKDDVDIAIVKELRRFNDETWFVKELHPEERDFTLKRSEWTCHVVVAISLGR